MMVGRPRDLHVQTRHVLFLVWSVTLLRTRSETQHPHPARSGEPVYLSCTTVAALGPRADATVRSTSLPKIDVSSARWTETASGERSRVTDELQGSKGCQRACFEPNQNNQQRNYNTSNKKRTLDEVLGDEC